MVAATMVATATASTTVRRCYQIGSHCERQFFVQSSWLAGYLPLAAAVCVYGFSMLFFDINRAWHSLCTCACARVHCKFVARHNQIHCLRCYDVNVRLFTFLWLLFLLLFVVCGFGQVSSTAAAAVCFPFLMSVTMQAMCLVHRISVLAIEWFAFYTSLSQ